MKKANILLCDDDIELCEAFKGELLRKHPSYNITLVTGGPQAIEHVKNNPTDLIVIDIKMPMMDGITAIEEIKKINSEVIILVFSYYHSIEVAKEALKRGALEYMIKPDDAVKVIETVQSLLKEKKKGKTHT